ncbi:MAG: SDR family oxidoreductase [Piscinibacter sp.]|uniref:SDR family oxidoreductase n=1 Tax=Piscinibacter TaxID=1114981 RepID=UPI000FDD4C5F|nr:MULTISPECIES: SDR family oxidoreductase [Piscinibacter]MCW5663615.1 SDR family oxidoreductase [Piscinibacter sp.]
MQIRDSVALVTGANRGIGRAFAQALLERGARKVYAAVRDPSRLDLPGVVPLALDVTSPEQVAAAAAQARDLTLLVNNAGIARLGAFLAEDAEQTARWHLETNLFGMLRLSRAFAPVLAAQGGGALLNVLSVASWVNGGALASYAMSKAAAWSLTNALRHELAAQHTQVTALHMGFVDTELTAGLEVPKSTPAQVVARALDGLEAGLPEVLADTITQQVKQALSTPGGTVASLGR